MNANIHLRSFPLAVVSFALFVALSACSDGGGDGDGDGETFEDFRDQVRGAAGRDADACGDVELNGSELEADTCLAQAFTNGTGAWPTVMQQGLDSFVASGTVVRDGRVIFYGFDSDPSGGGARNNGRISTTECVGPSLSGVVGDPQTGAFQCQEFVSSSNR